MGTDKKVLDGLTFVLDGPDGVEVVAGVDDEPVRAALARMLPCWPRAAHRAAAAAALDRARPRRLPRV